ncbi:hypothetical protein AK88_00133 [Plasmodium fragile]|uniref:Uncharacterized protein n=1 Tax=Plasmodium fragile TaxID=5857 RepID=A0A0D9QT92_PLAFR|nr:uncharacterized protein AK88_00133 [Plasmodium fragile]KJP90285.1 hypothetical protein AK88_00133 [Plasmodium fragile]
MKILRIDMLSTDSDLSESNFYSDGQERDLKRMEKKNTNWGLYNISSDVDSDKEYFSDCFEADTKAIPNGGEVFNENVTHEEGKKSAGDNAECGHGEDDLTSDLENFQSLDLSMSDEDDKRFGEKEKIIEKYKINIRTESDISFEEEKSFSHSIEVCDNAEEVQSRPLNFYGDESNDKPLGCATTEEHSVHGGNDAAGEVSERGDPFEGEDELTRKKDYSNEDAAEGERENHRNNEAEVEEEPNDKQIDTNAGEKDGESESGNDTKFGEAEKKVKECDTLDSGINVNYRNSTSKKELVNELSLTNEKRDGSIGGSGRPAGNFSFVLVGGVRHGNAPERGVYKANKRGTEVDVVGKTGHTRNVERRPSQFDCPRNVPLFAYYSMGKYAQNGEWERKQHHQSMDELNTSSAYERSEIGDSFSSDPENGAEYGDDDENYPHDGNFHQYQHENVVCKDGRPQYFPLYGNRSKLNKSENHKICLKSPLIRKQSFSEAPEQQCRQSEKRNTRNKKADHYIYMCRQKSREGRNDFNDPNCYMPPKKHNVYGEKLYEQRRVKEFKSVSKRTVGVQINLRAKKEYKTKEKTESECYIPSYRRVKIKIPVFELKQAEIKNYDYDAVVVKDGRVVPQKKDPIREFLRAYISYIDER